MSTETILRPKESRRQQEPSPQKGSKRDGGFASKFTVNGLLVLGCAYMVIPVVWLLFASTKNTADLYGTSAFAFGDFALFDNIANVARQDGGVFFRWMANSIIYAGFGAVFGGLIAVMAGYAFDKFNFRWKESFFGVVLIGVLVPNTATVLPMYLLASEVGLTNTMWAVLIPVLCNPFGVYLARVYSAGYIPAETLEAARVDGAGPIRSFFSIGLPMMVPGFVTIGLFQFVGVWNNFMLPLVMLQNQQLLPVSVGISIWQGHTVQLPDYAPLVITGSFLSIIPLLIAFTMLQRFWKSGLTAGSVK